MQRAVMAELADVQDLGSCVAGRVGSNPTNRIKRLLAKMGICRKSFCFFGKAVELLKKK